MLAEGRSNAPRGDVCLEVWNTMRSAHIEAAKFLDQLDAKSKLSLRQSCKTTYIFVNDTLANAEFLIGKSKPPPLPTTPILESLQRCTAITLHIDDDYTNEPTCRDGVEADVDTFLQRQGVLLSGSEPPDDATYQDLRKRLLWISMPLHGVSPEARARIRELTIICMYDAVSGGHWELLVIFLASLLPSLQRLELKSMGDGSYTSETHQRYMLQAVAERLPALRSLALPCCPSAPAISELSRLTSLSRFSLSSLQPSIWVAPGTSGMGRSVATDLLRRLCALTSLQELVMPATLFSIDLQGKVGGEGGPPPPDDLDEDEAWDKMAWDPEPDDGALQEATSGALGQVNWVRVTRFLCCLSAGFKLLELTRFADRPFAVVKLELKASNDKSNDKGKRAGAGKLQIYRTSIENLEVSLPSLERMVAGLLGSTRPCQSNISIQEMRVPHITLSSRPFRRQGAAFPMLRRLVGASGATIKCRQLCIYAQGNSQVGSRVLSSDLVCFRGAIRLSGSGHIHTQCLGCLILASCEHRYFSSTTAAECI